MKLIALAAAGILALGSISYVQAHGPDGHGKKHVRKMHMGANLEKITKELDLTDAQKAQVQPIVEQARPQIEAIHRDAMERTRVIVENATAQIRPLLTAEQQQKLDALKAAHEKMREAMREMHAAKSK